MHTIVRFKTATSCFKYIFYSSSLSVHSAVHQHLHIWETYLCSNCPLIVLLHQELVTLTALLWPQLQVGGVPILETWLQLVRAPIDQRNVQGLVAFIRNLTSGISKMCHKFNLWAFMKHDNGCYWLLYPHIYRSGSYQRFTHNKSINWTKISPHTLAPLPKNVQYFPPQYAQYQRKKKQQSIIQIATINIFEGFENKILSKNQPYNLDHGPTQI